MEYYLGLINLLIILDLFMILAGLIRPWWVLWFMHMQNRKMVLKYYGIPLIILLISRVILQS